jgi:hypothetical protein
MLRTLLEIALAPGLVVAATLAGRRWGSRTGGLVSAFPAVVGPVLLVTAQQRGTLFAERAAEGTLLGLVALSGFMLCYGRAALRAGWSVSLAVGWASAATLGAMAALAGGGVGLPASLGAASVSLVVAHRGLHLADGGPADLDAGSGTRDLAMRVLATVVMIALLTVAAELLGPRIGGVLAGLPALASVLAVFTHRAHGSAAVAALLRGMASGMAGFVGFCAVVALLIVPAGIAPAFLAAVATAAVVQLLALGGCDRIGAASLMGASPQMSAQRPHARSNPGRPQ